MLKRIYSSFSMSKLEQLMIALSKLFTSSYQKVIVNEFQIKKLKQIFSNRKGPVIFCPTHRSYVDFLVLSTVLYYYGMEVPLICSGEDFLGLSFVAEMLRGSGAFFMRRTFKGDDLYKSIFYEYVRYLNKEK
jgi:glycerol-3-phosphate O-acyltransferase